MGGTTPEHRCDRSRSKGPAKEVQERVSVWEWQEVCECSRARGCACGRAAMHMGGALDEPGACLARTCRAPACPGDSLPLNHLLG